MSPWWCLHGDASTHTAMRQRAGGDIHVVPATLVTINRKWTFWWKSEKTSTHVAQRLNLATNKLSTTWSLSFTVMVYEGCPTAVTRTGTLATLILIFKSSKTNLTKAESTSKKHAVVKITQISKFCLGWKQTYTIPFPSVEILDSRAHKASDEKEKKTASMMQRWKLN